MGQERSCWSESWWDIFERSRVVRCDDSLCELGIHTSFRFSLDWALLGRSLAEGGKSLHVKNTAAIACALPTILLALVPYFIWGDEWLRMNLIKLRYFSLVLDMDLIFNNLEPIINQTPPVLLLQHFLYFLHQPWHPSLSAFQGFNWCNSLTGNWWLSHGWEINW